MIFNFGYSDISFGGANELTQINTLVSE